MNAPYVQQKGNPTYVNIPRASTNAPFHCSSFSCRRYGASPGLLWTTRLCDHHTFRRVCHGRTRWDQSALHCCRRALGLLDWRDQYRGIVSAVCADGCHSVSTRHVSALGHERIFPLRSISDPAPLWGKHPRRGEQHVTRSVSTQAMETEPQREPLVEIPQASWTTDAWDRARRKRRAQ